MSPTQLYKIAVSTRTDIKKGSNEVGHESGTSCQVYFVVHRVHWCSDSVTVGASLIGT